MAGQRHEEELRIGHVPELLACGSCTSATDEAAISSGVITCTEARSTVPSPHGALRRPSPGDGQIASTVCAAETDARTAYQAFRFHQHCA
jgi:hypothetical protein